MIPSPLSGRSSPVSASTKPAMLTSAGVGGGGGGGGAGPVESVVQAARPAVSAAAIDARIRIARNLVMGCPRNAPLRSRVSYLVPCPAGYRCRIGRKARASRRLAASKSNKTRWETSSTQTTNGDLDFGQDRKSLRRGMLGQIPQPKLVGRGPWRAYEGRGGVFSSLPNSGGTSLCRWPTRSQPGSQSRPSASASGRAASIDARSASLKHGESGRLCTHRHAPSSKIQKSGFSAVAVPRFLLDTRPAPDT